MPTAIVAQFRIPMKPADPREQAVYLGASVESVEAAIDACNGERLKARRDGCAVALVPYPHDAEPFDRACAMSVVEELIHVWGAKRVASWVRNLAAINGEDI